MSATEGFAHPEFLIATDELEHRLGDPDLLIFDCTIHLIPNPDIGYTVRPGRADFENGHIPGAQFIDLQADLSAPHPKLRWMLRNYGFDHAAVLDGGFQKWSHEGRPVESGPSRARAPATFVVRADRRLMVGKEA